MRKGGEKMHKALEEMIGRWFLYILDNDAEENITKLAKLLGTDYKHVSYDCTIQGKGRIEQKSG